MKRHWWSLALSWPDDNQGMFSTAHDVFFKEMGKSTDLSLLFLLTEIDSHTCFIYCLHDFMLLYVELVIFLHIRFIVMSIHH